MRIAFSTDETLSACSGVYLGGRVVHVYTVFVLSLHCEQVSGTRLCVLIVSPHTHTHAPPAPHRLFKMCLMTAMRACRDAFAALQWNTQPAKAVAKPPSASALTGISHRPIISIRRADKLSDCNYICPNAKSDCLRCFPPEEWGAMNGPIVNRSRCFLSAPVKPAELGRAPLITRFLLLSDWLTGWRLWANPPVQTTRDLARELAPPPPEVDQSHFLSCYFTKGKIYLWHTQVLRRP